MTVKNTQKDRALINFYLDHHKISRILSKTLIQELKVFRFKAGDYLIRTHDQLEYLYFFVEGKAKVFITMENGNSLLVRFYEPLELVGDVEFASSNRHICNMQAISDVVCLGIKVEIVKSSLESNTKLLLHICKSLGEKLTSFNMTSAINQMYPLENKLASYLVAISDHNKIETGKVREIHTENLTELAALLGTSYRQLNRVIRKLKDQKILERFGRRFEILDMEQIIDLSCDIYG